jgi:hypothetical protein
MERTRFTLQTRWRCFWPRFAPATSTCTRGKRQTPSSQNGRARDAHGMRGARSIVMPVCGITPALLPGIVPQAVCFGGPDFQSRNGSGQNELLLPGRYAETPAMSASPRRAQQSLANKKCILIKTGATTILTLLMLTPVPALSGGTCILHPEPFAIGHGSLVDQDQFRRPVHSGFALVDDHDRRYFRHRATKSGTAGSAGTIVPLLLESRRKRDRFVQALDHRIISAH